MVAENSFQSRLIKSLETLFPECIILKNDANYLQGFPDILILFENKWAALETKKSKTASKRPNQDYYIKRLDAMSYASFVHPENKEKVLNELQEAFRVDRPTRVFKR